MKFTFTDLFSGIGGFRLAFESFGGKCVFSSEIDKWAAQTYLANFGDIPSGDIREIPAESIPDHDILTAGFPCQPFSISGFKKGFADTRGTLFFEIARILEAKKPRAFLLENVRGLLHHDSGRTLKVILETLQNLDYNVFYQVLKSSGFGVPQKRERIYIVGFLDKIADFIFPTGKKTEKVIADIMETDVPEIYWLSEKAVKGLEKHKERNFAKNGFGYRLSDIHGLSYTLVAANGGQKSRLFIDHNIPENYSRNSRHIRTFTPRELARLQGFPEDFIIPVARSRVYKQFGNSVSVPVVCAVAERILRVFEGENLCV